MRGREVGIQKTGKFVSSIVRSSWIMSKVEKS
jgi:hypothetical protein